MAVKCKENSNLISEKELEDYILNTGYTELFNAGLHHPPFSKSKRQLRIGKYGIADIVDFQPPCLNTGIKFPTEYSRHSNGKVFIYELKKDLISTKTLNQSLKYLGGIKSYLKKNHKLIADNVDFQIILIGNRIDHKSNICYSVEAFDNLFIYTYSVSGLSICFKREQGYKRINEGF